MSIEMVPNPIPDNGYAVTEPKSFQPILDAVDIAGKAIKHDADKDPWHLLPWDALREVTKILAFGAKKYGDRNWEKGFEYHRLYRAAIEHLSAWFTNKDPGGKDPETGRSHLAHAACCVLMLLAHELRGIGTDDRPNL